MTTKERVLSLTFRNMYALSREAMKPAKLGFNPHDRFTGAGMKVRFGEWICDNIPEAKILSLITGYEQASEQARQHIAARVNHPIPVTRNSTPRPAMTTATPNAEQDVNAIVAAATGTPSAAPVAAPITPEAEDEVAAALRVIMNAGRNVNPEQVQAICRAEIAEALRALTLPRPLLVTVQNAEVTTETNVGRQHMMFPRLLNRMARRDRKGNRLNIWIAGPAGSGKTTAAQTACATMGLPFYSTGALDGDFRLVGYKDVNGVYQDTPFYHAFKNGGGYLWDEADASHESAHLALNAALANGFMVFPNGEMVQRHPDFIMLAAANTWGAGATFEYVGRLKQDAAAMDRYIKLPWDYDTSFETEFSGNEAWARKVIRWRENVRNAGIKHVISPRATFLGADLLAQGVPEAEVIAELVSAGLTPAQWRQVA